jgi:hypothetical protein
MQQIFDACDPGGRRAMKAIVYISGAGHTRRYAKLLEKITGLPAFSYQEALEKVPASSEILYMGWIMAGKIKGFSKARSRYRVKAVCAVGMGAPDDSQVPDLIKRNHTDSLKLFYLQGGYDIGLLRGLNRFMMKNMSRLISTSIEKKETKTDADAETLEMIKNGKDFVSEANLEPIVAWYAKQIA